MWWHCWTRNFFSILVLLLLLCTVHLPPQTFLAMWWKNRYFICSQLTFFQWINFWTAFWTPSLLTFPFSTRPHTSRCPYCTEKWASTFFTFCAACSSAALLRKKKEKQMSTRKNGETKDRLQELASAKFATVPEGARQGNELAAVAAERQCKGQVRKCVSRASLSFFLPIEPFVCSPHSHNCHC